LLTAIAATLLAILAVIITGVRTVWAGSRPETHPRVYFSNHSSHGDFLVIWAVLPHRVRRLTRPVAASDYWHSNRIRRFVADRLVRAVVIARHNGDAADHPIEAMTEALESGRSLIFFPEGTRNNSEEPLLPFKSGLYHLAKARKGLEFVPVWLENLNRVLPKGELIPLPILCTVTFGAPIRLEPGEKRQAFLDRARQSLLATAPRRRRDA
jgi:1-acyl-sn-glycerol-3-phosphate acyltransferase